MAALNYLKLDLKLIKGSLKFYIVFPVIFIPFMINTDNIGMGIGYLFFFLFIFATVPFSVEGYESCRKMYYMFPARISSMVLGRFMYLCIIMAVIWVFNAGVLIYLSLIGKESFLTIKIAVLDGMIACIVSFLQYPLYYKYGIEKGKFLSIILYIIPAISIFSLPSIIKGIKLNDSFNLEIVILVIIGILIASISYKLSCVICKNKEI
jgi:ABC-2 type transport system permease protein